MKHKANTNEGGKGFFTRLIKESQTCAGISHYNIPLGAATS